MNSIPVKQLEDTTREQAERVRWRHSCTDQLIYRSGELLAMQAFALDINKKTKLCLKNVWAWACIPPPQACKLIIFPERHFTPGLQKKLDRFRVQWHCVQHRKITSKWNPFTWRRFAWTLCVFITSLGMAYNFMRAEKRNGLAARDRGKQSGGVQTWPWPGSSRLNNTIA